MNFKKWSIEKKVNYLIYWFYNEYCVNHGGGYFTTQDVKKIRTDRHVYFRINKIDDKWNLIADYYGNGYEKVNISEELLKINNKYYNKFIKGLTEIIDEILPDLIFREERTYQFWENELKNGYISSTADPERDKLKKIFEESN